MKTTKFIATVMAFCVIRSFSLIPEAHAGGFLNPIQSATGAGTSGAGVTASGEDPATIWYNPAGMGRLHQPDALLSGGVLFPSSLFKDRGSTDSLGFPAQGNSVTNPTNFFLPSIFGSLPVGENVHVGIGALVPFGDSSKYDNDWVGRYQVQQILLKTIDIRPALAYRVTDSISVGAALDIQYAKLQSTSAIDFGSLCLASGLCMSAGPGSLDGRLVTRLTNWDVGYDLGAIVDLTSDVRVGVNYKSGFHSNLQGSAKFNVPDQAFPLTIIGAFRNTAAATAVDFPDIVSFGSVWKVDNQLTTMFDATWTKWSDTRKFSLKFGNLTPAQVQILDWRDSWRIAFGGSYRVDERNTVRAGVAFDQSPINGRFRTALLPQADSLMLGAGISHRVSENLQIGFSYNYVQEANASLHVGQLAAGTLIGTVRQHSHALGVESRFQF